MLSFIGEQAANIAILAEDTIYARRTMKTLSYLVILPGLAFSLAACQQNDPDKRDTIDFAASLSASLVVGQGSNSLATGFFTGIYTKSTRAFMYSVAYSGMTLTGAFIGIGAPNTNGPTDNVYLFTGRGNPLTGSATLTLQQENNLIAGNNYIVLTSSKFPQGELHGTIGLKK